MVSWASYGPWAGRSPPLEWTETSVTCPVPHLTGRCPPARMQEHCWGPGAVGPSPSVMTVWVTSVSLCDSEKVRPGGPPGPTPGEESHRRGVEGLAPPGIGGWGGERPVHSSWVCGLGSRSPSELHSVSGGVLGTQCVLSLLGCRVVFWLSGSWRVPDGAAGPGCAVGVAECFLERADRSRGLSPALWLCHCCLRAVLDCPQGASAPVPWLPHSQSQGRPGGSRPAFRACGQGWSARRARNVHLLRDLCFSVTSRNQALLHSCVREGPAGVSG